MNSRAAASTASTTRGRLRRIDLDAATQADAREERLAKNEILFRGVNEAIEQQALVFGGLDDYEFICECSSTACSNRIRLTLREYEHIRSEGTRFFVSPGHQNAEVELVVDANRHFLVVEKDGTAGIMAELADPRDGDPPL